MVIETSAAAVTVRLALPETVPDVAVMVVEPVASACARPAVPADMLTVATLGINDVHCTEAVKSWVELSLYVPVAVNCSVVPSGAEAVEDETAIDTRTALLSCTVREPLTVPFWALIVALPAVARPEMLTVATAASEEDQVTPETRVCVVPSE